MGASASAGMHRVGKTLKDLQQQRESCVQRITDYLLTT